MTREEARETYKDLIENYGWDKAMLIQFAKHILSRWFWSKTMPKCLHCGR